MSITDVFLSYIFDLNVKFFSVIKLFGKLKKMEKAERMEVKQARDF